MAMRKNIMQVIIAILLIVASSYTTKAQKLEWAGILNKIHESNGNVRCFGLKSVGDYYGNTYIAGYFTDSLNLNLMGGTSITLNTANLWGTAFVAKYDSNGVFQFVKKFECTGQNSSVYSIDANADGFVIYGNYNNVCTYDSNGVTATLPSYSLSSASFPYYSKFIASYTATGHLKWIKHFKPIAVDGSEINYQIRLNPYNMNIACLTGYYDTVNFLGVNYDSTFKRGPNQLLVEMDSSGNVLNTSLFKRGSQISSTLHAEMVWTTKNELYLTGTYTDTLQIITASGINMLTDTNKNSKCFVVRFDSTMSVDFLHSFGKTNANDSAAHNSIQGIAVDTVTKSYTLLVSFSSLNYAFNDTNSKYQLNPRFPSETVLVRYDSNGHVQWLKGLFANHYYDNALKAMSFTVAVNGDYLIQTVLERTCDLDPGTGVQNSNTVVNGVPLNSTLIRYSDTGRLIWHQSLKSATGFFTCNVNVDLNDNIYLATVVSASPGFSNQLDIDMSNANTNLFTIPSIERNILLEKLSPCNNEQGLLPIESCAPFLLPSGQQIFSDGTYPYSSLDSEACLTSFNYVVDILETDTTIAQNGAVLQAINGTAQNTYQWINCSTKLPINGATTNSYEATENGTYAVIVSNGSCADTSACYTVTNVAVQHALATNFSVRKIGSNKFLISGVLPSEGITCFDMLGRQIAFTTAVSNSYTELTINNYTGMAFVNIGGGTQKVLVSQ
jgi:hypothetical protein